MAVRCPECSAVNPASSKFCAACGRPLGLAVPDAPVTETIRVSPHEPSRGASFAGRYRIIEKIGRGGMGTVYRVFDGKLDEEVALKLIRPDVAADAETLERFGSEVRLARKIAHPRVGRVYELMEHEGTHFITMEYIPGEDLRSFIKRAAPLSVRKAVAIARQVCDGLSEAHGLGIVHRDLKPSNIMIDKEGQARIMDFGIARLLTVKGLTAAGVTIGTPEYMSPEQAEAKEVDARSDIYSLGVVLYEMVTGRTPFEGETPLALALKHKNETPRDPREWNPLLPESAARLVLQCLEKVPGRRFQSAAEMDAALERIENELPATDRKAPTGKPFSRPTITGPLSGKKRLIAGAGLVVLAVLVATAVLLTRSGGPPSRSGTPDRPRASSWENSLVVLPLKNASGDPREAGFCDGITDQITANLSRLASLKVIDSSSARRIDMAANSVQEIGRILDVKYVLEGSLQKSGDRIRLTAKLVSAVDGTLPWAESYDRDLKDIFAVQDDVSERIAAALVRELTPDAAREVRTFRSDDPEAYVAYAEGAHLANRFDHVPEVGLFKSAEARLKRCIELDPKYAPAYAELSYLYHNYRGYRAASDEERKRFFDLSEELCRKAMELGPGRAEVLFAEAWSHWRNRETDELYKATRRLLEIQPNHVRGNLLMGYVLRNNGLIDKAFPYFDKARVLDPLEPWAIGARARAYWMRGDVQEAFAGFDTSLEIEPDDSEMLGYYASALLQMRMADRAGPLLSKYRLLRTGQSLVNYEAWLLALRGRSEEAVRYLEEHQGTDEGKMILDNLLGRYEEVVDYWVKTAELESKDLTISRYLYLKNHPFYDTIRQDARFQRVLAREELKYPLVLKHFGFEE